MKTVWPNRNAEKGPGVRGGWQPRPLTPGIFYLILRMPLGRFYLGVVSWYHQKED